MKRWLAAAVLGMLGVAAVVWFAVPNGAAREPDLIFIVIDTLRGDRTSICGHDRPTTPTLEGLVGDGWSVSCGAVSPGSWTLPSHGSFFTGRTVIDVKGSPEHGPTLAEKMAARGYQSVMVSGNMVLRQGWLANGFDQVRIARNFRELRGPKLAAELDRQLAELDPERPALVFVNIIDAHSPYPAVPADAGWLPEQPPVHQRRFQQNRETPFNRFVTGQMSPDEHARYQQRLENGYDWGVHHADSSVQAVLATLQDHGRLAHHRAVITSDHGEFLGEHHQVGHGDTLFEPSVRVPLLYHASDGSTPELPDLMEARLAHQLLETGTLDVDGPVLSATYFVQSERESYNGVAVWTPDSAGKLLWRDGEYQYFDLASDPSEDQARPLGEHPMRDTLEALVEANAPAIDKHGDYSEDTIELLRAAGYVE